MRAFFSIKKSGRRSGAQKSLPEGRLFPHKHHNYKMAESYFFCCKDRANRRIVQSQYVGILRRSGLRRGRRDAADCRPNRFSLVIGSRSQRSEPPQGGAAARRLQKSRKEDSNSLSCHIEPRGSAGRSLGAAEARSTSFAEPSAGCNPQCATILVLLSVRTAGLPLCRSQFFVIFVG